MLQSLPTLILTQTHDALDGHPVLFSKMAVVKVAANPLVLGSVGREILLSLSSPLRTRLDKGLPEVYM